MSSSYTALAQEDPSERNAPIELQELSSPTEPDNEQGSDTIQEAYRSHNSLDSDRTLLPERIVQEEYRSPNSMDSARTMVFEPGEPSQTSPAERTSGSMGNERMVSGGDIIVSPSHGGCFQCICANKGYIAGFACVGVCLGAALANDCIKNRVFDGDTSDGVSSPVPSVLVHPVNDITTALDSLSLSQGADVTTNEPVTAGSSTDGSTLLRRRKQSQATPAKATPKAEDSVQ